MKVKLVTVKAFEVFDGQGTSLGLFMVDSEWQGFQSLKSVKGDESIIIACEDDSFSKVFADVFGHARADALVLKASPSLVAKLKEATGSIDTLSGG